MSLFLTIKLAWKNIIGNRLRSGLTMLGLVIGIASVILLVGIVNGATKSINEQMSSLGSDIISGYMYADEGSLTYDDILQMQNLQYVAGVTPMTAMDGSISKGGKTLSSASILGVGEGFADIMGYQLEYGRDISRIDLNDYTKCAIIGSKVAEKFWKGKDPCGDTIKIDGDDYVVIGSLVSEGSSMGSNTDSSVMIPATAGAYLGAGSSMDEFYVKASSDDDVEAAQDSVETYFSKSKGWVADNDYSLESQQSLQESMGEVNRILGLLLGGIASISLVVGGIGVMNVMLVSVTERTKEIGIRKSLGARRKDILIQFLLESMVLSLMGGTMGVLAGLIFGRVAVLLGAYFSPSIGMILLAFGVSIGVGLVFGILPAYRAAKMRPVDALRYE